MGNPTFPCESCGTFHSASEVSDAGGYSPQCDSDYDERKMFADLVSRYAALEAENARLADALDRQSVITGDYIARCQRLADERDALAAELEAIKGQQPVAFYWQDIGYPEPRKHGPYFGWPSESALRNVDGGAMPVPLYTSPKPGPDVRALVSADDVREACANAVSVFAEETNAGQCREVAEYMREVLLAQIAHRAASGKEG